MSLDFSVFRRNAAALLALLLLMPAAACRKNKNGGGTDSSSAGAAVTSSSSGTASGSGSSAASSSSGTASGSGSTVTSQPEKPNTPSGGDETPSGGNSSGTSDPAGSENPTKTDVYDTLVQEKNNGVIYQSGERYYYLDADGVLSSVTTDGKEKKTIFKEGTVCQYAVLNGYAYASVLSDSSGAGKIYRIPLSGGKAVDCGVNSAWFTVGSWEKPDGSGKKEDYLFYIDQDNGEKLSRRQIENTAAAVVVLSDRKCGASVFMLEDSVYFSGYNDVSNVEELCTSKIDGSKRDSLIISKTGSVFFLSEKMLYFTKSTGGIYRADLDGANEKTLSADKKETDIKITFVGNNKLYYRCKAGSEEELISVSLTDNSKKILWQGK